MTTQRQKAAVHFCEYMLDIEFKGDIDSFIEVSNFLSNHLAHAKDIRDQLEYCIYDIY